MRFIQLLLISWSIAIPNLPGQNLVIAKKSAKQDLENAITKLNDLRKKIELEKIPLSSEVTALEKEAQEKRQEVDRRTRMRDNRDANLMQLKEEVKAGDAEIDSIQRILADYTRSWSEFTPPAEKIITNNLIQNTIKNPPYVSASAGGSSMFLIFVIIILLGVIGAGGYFCFSMKPDLFGNVVESVAAPAEAPAVAAE